MTYSKQAEQKLSEQGIKVGDLILIQSTQASYEGTLMPNHDFSHPDVLIIKLDSGYNTGVRIGPGTALKKTGEKQEKPQTQKTGHFDPSKPRITLVATGGTITSKIDYRTGGVVSLLEPPELLDLAPELYDIAVIQDILKPFNKMSEDMKPGDWKKLATETAKAHNESEGVIITHGTDTLHYTASALSFMVKDSKKPIVLTGSQRSSDRPSTDASMNLICSARIAAHSDLAHTGICMHATMNDDYCEFLQGTRARKMHTTRRDAFRPLNDTPIARVWPEGKIRVLKKDYKKKGKGDAHADAVFEEKTALLHSFPGSSESLEALVDKSYGGIVLAGTGLGHIPQDWIPAVQRGTEQGTLFCMTAQTLYGRLNPLVYSTGRELLSNKVLFLEDMLPETAYVKLGWVLGHNLSEEESRKMMAQNISGEISARTLPGGFI